jgi:signal transduction histidine kinase
MGQLLGDLRGAFEYELRQKNIALSLNGPMPRLHVEKTRFREVFQNLIDNAIKYMPARPDRRIDIAYRLQGQAHHFTVSDNGPGIAPEDQQRVFFVFRRGSSPATAGVPGKGVGLALVKTIVSNYQGRVWVESCPPEGSTFHVELPSRTTSGASEGSSHDEAAKPAAVSVAG